MKQFSKIFLRQRKIIIYGLIIVALPCFASAQSEQISSDSMFYADIISTKVICKQQGKYIGWPSITKTRSGELLVVFSGNREAHVCPFGITQMIRSTDNGETWSKPETINNTPLDDRDAGILETKNGTLLVSWFTSLAFDKENYYEKNPAWRLHADKLGDKTKKFWIGNWTRRSLNGGQSWEDPVKQVVSAPHGPIELSDGRLLYVGTGHVNDKKTISVEQSTDDGQSWQLISTIPLASEEDVAHYHEPHVVELSNGKLVAMIRYQPPSREQSYLRQSESYDGGRTWTTSHKTGIWGYPPHLIQLNNGWLLVSYGVRREPFGEMACISKDNGETWETDKEIMINPAMNSDLGYPASLQLDDGSILTVYYQIDMKGEKTSLLCTQWRLQEPAFTSVTTTNILNIGSRLELFVDDLLIEKQNNVSRILHTPKDAGIVMLFDKPWEGPFCGYSTIIKDSATYRLYYRGLPEAGKDGSTTETTCYAESYDGINWTKPDLGIYEIPGTLSNNVILANDAPYSHNFSPFLDIKPGVPANERYKAVAGTHETGLFGFKSADGIHWSKIQESPIFRDGIFDSQNVAFWSESENCYTCYFRSWTGDGYTGIRTISRTTSPDFIHWSEPLEMDFGDTSMEQLYTNQTAPYYRAPHIYVAIAARFMPNRQVLTEEQALRLNVNPKYFKDCSDAVLMTSRGGNKYDRTFMDGFIRPGIGLQNWVSRSNYPALNVVQTGPAEMSIFVNQDYAQPTAHIHRYTLRIDGFMSLRAPYEGGEMITKPFYFTGDKLVLNFSTSAAGFIKVEMLDINGNKIGGYELENSKEMIGNEIEKAVSWQGNPDLKKLVDQPVKLRFVMKDADLFSIKFE
ncbi:MAG: sialidase family protein [Bacteroidota bacterium]|nr:sialidase family protein [Bacteroidota bacterium]